MNSNFESRKNQRQPGRGDSLAGNSADNKKPLGAVNTMMRDRFELLSAYLDGEVTSQERRQVEEWLDTDPATQRLYQRLLNLRHGLQAMPVPSSQPADQLAEAVFKRVDRRPKLVLFWSGAAIAAMFVGMVSGIVPGRQLFMPQVAQVPQPTPSGDLMVALNEPLVEIVNPNELMLTVNEPIVEIPKPGVTKPSANLQN